MRLSISLDKEYRDRVFVERGEELSAELTYEVPLADLTPEDRKVLAGLPEWDGARVLRLVNGHIYHAPFAPDSVENWHALLASFAEVNAPLVAEQAEKEAAERKRLHEGWDADLALLRRAVAENVDVDEERRALPYFPSSKYPLQPYAEHAATYPHRDEYIALAAQYDRQRAARVQAVEEARRAHEEEQRKQREWEKREWIEAYGSAHLREAFAAGYDCQRLYATERAQREYPSYTLDFDRNAEWVSRSCPSPEALAEANRVGGRVVWLTASAKAPDDNDMVEWEECEAVVVESFLGRYVLLREIRGEPAES